MVENAEKVLVIGLDAPIVPSLLRFIEEGCLPNMGRLVHEGTLADNCLVPLPTITPPNWTGISTGATTGTHGITCFNLHKPGMPLNDICIAFDTQDCRAEFFWDAAGRAGKTTIVLNYPVSWPPTSEQTIVVGSHGVGVNEWGENGDGFPWITLASDQLFATEMYPQATQISLREAKDWQNVEINPGDLEAELPLRYRGVSVKVGEIEQQTWYLLARRSAENDYDQVVVAPTKDASTAFAVLGAGDLSDNCYADFTTSHGVRRVGFRFKLIELSADARLMRLYVTPLCQMDGWAYPPEIASEIESPDGLPIPVVGFEAYALDWIDIQTYVDLCEIANNWYADAATQIMARHNWDAFFMHAHCLDLFYHLVLEKLQPTEDASVAYREEWVKYERALYVSLDKMIGRIVKSAGEKAVVVLVSDHGVAPTHTKIDLPELFVDAGLTVLKDDAETGLKTIDWSRTRAILQRSVYAYVNLKGRDPEGIVEPGEEYEQVRERIIQVLYDYTDSTGRKPVALALRKEDALVLGLKGDRIGDVIYAIREGYGGEMSIHGPQLPTAAYGVGSLRGLLVLHGPGVKKGYRMERTAHLQDVVPTICYLARIPVPAQVEGGILYQALEEPNGLIEELNHLRKNYERLENAYERKRALTHQYNR